MDDLRLCLKQILSSAVSPLAFCGERWYDKPQEFPQKDGRGGMTLGFYKDHYDVVIIGRL